MNDRNDFCGFSPQLIIPTTFEECFTYEEQILYLKQLIEEGGEADLTEIEQRLSAVEASVATLNDEVSQINVDEINVQLQSINADLTELKNKSSAQADSITALQSTVTTQGTEISTVKRQVETQATAVTNLSNSLSTTNTNVTKNTNDIATNTANIASLQTTVAGKQNTLTFDNTPTAGSTNPVTSDGIRKAIDEAGGGTSTVEWVETNLDEFIASLPANVTYTTNITLQHINDSEKSLVPNNMIIGTFTQTGMFISSDKRYLKIVLNVTNPRYGTSFGGNMSYNAYIKSAKCPFVYSAYYVTITQENEDIEFLFTNSLYSIRRDYHNVYSSSRYTAEGPLDVGDVTTCNVYFKLFPELPIDLT